MKNRISGWPNSELECRKMAMAFSKLSKPYRFPNVVGCVDGTLVSIQAPAKSCGIFVDRYRGTSLNVLGIKNKFRNSENRHNLGICDHKRRFLFLSSRLPGRTHDARVFNKTIGLKFDSGFRPFPNSVLLGDSAFPSTDYMVKMVSTPPENLTKFYRFNI
jgi:hypothetical protein